jgi:hypothetical protein
MLSVLEPNQIELSSITVYKDIYCLFGKYLLASGPTRLTGQIVPYLKNPFFFDLCLCLQEMSNRPYNCADMLGYCSGGATSSGQGQARNQLVCRVDVHRCRGCQFGAHLIWGCLSYISCSNAHSPSALALLCPDHKVIPPPVEVSLNTSTAIILLITGILQGQSRRLRLPLCYVIGQIRAMGYSLHDAGFLDSEMGCL